MNRKHSRSVLCPVGQSMCTASLFQDIVGALVFSHRDPAVWHSQPRLWQPGWSRGYSRPDVAL